MRLIDADELRNLYEGEQITEDMHCSIRVIRQNIDDMPTVDAVEVVRCADCKHCQVDNLFDNCWCDGQSVWADHYCSKGERR